MIDLIGTRDTYCGDEWTHLETVRQRAINATRNPECTKEFLAHSVADIEWLCDHVRRAISEGLSDDDEYCDACDRAESQLESVREDLDEARCALRSAQKENRELGEKVAELKEKVAELKDELKRLHFRMGA